MKKLLFTLMPVIGMFCFSGISAQDAFYGAKIDDTGAVPVKELVAKMEGNPEMDITIIGKVEEVCQVKGCWMTISKEDGTTMRVTFKDYGFFVPKDIAGKTAVLKGKAYTKVTTVAELQHYAEDGGKSKEEIEKIKEDKTELAFEAEGVIIR
jgi:hypothetical protein